jgi:hypothetical protein
MHNVQAIPKFGGKRNALDYYSAVNTIIRTLRPQATLRVIAQHLAANGFLTPSNLVWTRERVATYIQQNSI